MDAVEPIVAVAGATVALGVNLDDLDAHRPGQEAARPRGAVFPLVEAGFTKDDVRAVSHQLRLRTWAKPAPPSLPPRPPSAVPVTLGQPPSLAPAQAPLRAMGVAELRLP